MALRIPHRISAVWYSVDHRYVCKSLKIQLMVWCNSGGALGPPWPSATTSTPCFVCTGGLNHEPSASQPGSLQTELLPPQTAHKDIYLHLCCLIRNLTWTCPPSDNTASILTRRASYSRLQQSMYLVPVVITDGDYPMQSSTGTLTVRVCTCDREGNMELCNAQPLSSTPGLSTGALIAILLCAIILLSK